MTEETDQMTDDQHTEEIPEEAQEEQPEEQLEDTFPRKYVEELRDENARYRKRAQQADDLAHRVHRLMVERTGRLADPDDLEFDEEHLQDEATLAAALDALLDAKPHLASRRPTGDIGQGATQAGGAVDLAALMRKAAN